MRSHTSLTKVYTEQGIVGIRLKNEVNISADLLHSDTRDEVCVKRTVLLCVKACSVYVVLSVHVCVCVSALLKTDEWME